MCNKIGDLDAPFAPHLPLLHCLLPPFPFALVLLALGLKSDIACVTWCGFVLLTLLVLACIIVCIGLKLFVAFLVFW